MSQENNTNLFLPISIIIAGFVIAGAVIYTSQTKEAENKQPEQNETGTEEINDLVLENYIIDEKGWPTIGDEDAPVTIVEYSDFACSFCGRFALNTLPLIKTNYIDTGIVKFIYKDFGVVGGDRAAEAAHCAAEQGKYWEYHDLLFAKSAQDFRTWSNSNTHAGYAASLNLNSEELVECFESRRYQDKVAESAREATVNGGQGTPYFIVNGIPVSGAQPYEVFEQVIQIALELQK